MRDGIAYAMFAIDDVRTETKRLEKDGVRFTQEATG